MQLTSFTDYGLRSLMYLAARPESTCSVREIADYYGISRNHLVKVIHRLAQTEYIISSKGKGGGIRLAEQAATSRLGDIVRALEPSMHLVECFDPVSNSCCISEACKLKQYLSEAQNQFLQALNQYTLADTVKNPTLFFTQSQ